MEKAPISSSSFSIGTSTVDARSTERDRRGGDTVGGVVGSVAHLPCPHDMIKVTARRRSKGSALQKFDKCWRRAEMRGDAKRLAIVTHQHPEFGLANSRGILEQGLENRLQVAERSRDHLEHVGSCGLLLQRLRSSLSKRALSIAITA